MSLEAFFIYPLINILVIFYKGLLFLNIPFALGFSIIALTVFIRFVLYPLTSAQIKASKKMQDVAPHISNLKEKHKGDSKMLQQETMRLYKEHGVNPAAGCLPVIIQLPIIWSLYSVLDTAVKLNANTVVAYINKIVYFDFLKIQKAWDTSFFGLPLGQTPSNLMSSIGFAILLVPVATGVFQFVQSKMMFPAVNKNLPVLGEKKKEDFASAFQSQSTYIFPIMIAFFSYGFPVGLSLYWNTFTIFGIIQQYKLTGLGGTEPWVKLLKNYGKKS